MLVVWDAPTVNSNLVEFYHVQYTAERARQLTANASLVSSLRIIERTSEIVVWKLKTWDIIFDVKLEFWTNMQPVDVN